MTVRNGVHGKNSAVFVLPGANVIYKHAYVYKNT